MSAVDAGVGRATAARWRTVRRVGVGAVLAGVTVGIVLAPGFDEREVRADDPSVWALQTATGERFARINTAVSELDTVKTVNDPSELVQYENQLLVYSDNLGSVTTLDVARPYDIDPATSEATAATPLGTDAVVHNGDFVVYLTDAGEVLAGQVSAGTAPSPMTLDPYRDVQVAEGEDRPQFRAVAVAVSPDGRVIAYSAQRQAVFVADAVTGEVTAEEVVPDGPTGEDVQVAWVGGTWVVLDAEAGLVWIRGVPEPIATDATPAARLQASVVDGDRAIIADDFGVIVVAFDGSGSTRVHGSNELALGQPARPVAMPDGGTIAAAWLPAGEGPGTLWLSSGATTPLDYGGASLGDRRSPQLRTNGTRLILNEGRSGWVWSVPSGQLVRSSQEWTIDQDLSSAADDQEVASQVTDPRAPVAENDEFGVRAGRQVMLPVLLNDHDANEDVLTVVPGSATGLDPSFGTVVASDEDQALVVDVAPSASGSATFTYAVTDGTTSDGLESAPATVTLTVKSESENSAPVWCGVEDCLVTWPTPQVNPGGTVTADVLSGWVDPEGDPIYLAGATTQATVGVVAASPEGQVVFQHTNASSTESGAVPIEVRVSDTHGATATRALTVSVLGEPELRASDLAVTVTAGVTTTVQLADQVTGARGPLQVTEASLGVDDTATIAVAQGLIGFTFGAEEPGSYLVDFTVTDGLSESRAVARVTVIPPEDERLTTVPLTAFVRAREDATIGVLSAVTNPGGHVLLLSDLETEPADGAQLSADIVGHSALRISGDTADGQSGTLGVVRYTVSDGSGRPEATVRGEVTVVLLDSDLPTTPLAVDDAITVRVGTQADIPVLANDLGPAGNVIALDASSVEADAAAGLAFPAGSRIRYLAPDEPGVYEIGYAAYVLGYPAQQDTARVVVTVLASDTNAPPTPQRLSGRVASGETVRLPFNGTGIDPDGDAVTLQRVETQPVSGSARVASDGQSLVYTADSGFAGQVSFTFSVTDARGQSAIATATVGVLAADVDPRPVTYSDYVQAQVGAERRVILTPTANDIDLAGGELELVDVRPDAPVGSEEHAALASLILGVEDGQVLMAVGEEPGTFSFVYTVRNDGGSTAIGRIILKAVREPVADVPIVADTVLTAETRETFTTGVDVLTDKVSWGSGDAASLTLSLYGSPTDLTVSGRSISGPLPEMGRLVPFRVEGTNFAGEEVESYGFLRVPGEQDIRVALKDPFTPPEVDEGASVTFDVLDLIALPEGVEISIDADGVTASGTREGSTCRFIAGTSVRYTAGEGEPYTDTCLVPVLVVGHDEPTLLPVPITIIAAAPQPILTGASLEISPGDTATFDIAGMVSWPAGAQGRPVEYAVAYQGDQFEVERAGTVLTVTALDRSIPGQFDAVTVSLPSDPETTAVSLSLEVGPAPSQLPKGATVVQRCSQAAGTSCTITVAGVSGEVNPLPGTPLELVGVTAGGTCPTVSFATVDSRTVRATWTADTPGAVCDATFQVRDAQGRVSAGDRSGAISLDLQGFPQAPSEIRQTAFGDGTVTLAVTPGAASSAYPSVTGFAVYDGSNLVTTCSASGACPQVTGLTNGAKRQFTAKAVNSVGESRAAVTTTAWSYAPPAAPTRLSMVPSQNTGGAGLRADLTFTITDATTREVTISSGTGDTITRPVATNGDPTVVPGYFVGSNSPQTVTVTPVTRLELPPISGANAQGAAATVAAHGVGKPTITQVTDALSSGENQVTFTVSVTSGGADSVTRVGVAQRGQECRDLTTAANGQAQVTMDISPYAVVSFDICARSVYSDTPYAWADGVSRDVFAFPDPGAPVIDRGYRVEDRCNSGQAVCETRVTDGPRFSFKPPYLLVQYSVNGGAWSQDFWVPEGASSDIRARYCAQNRGTLACSASWTDVPADTGDPEYPMGILVNPCVAADHTAGAIETALLGTVNIHAAAGDIASRTWVLYDADGAVTTDWALVRSGRPSATFQGALANLADWEGPLVQCDVPPEPEPEPDPDPSPDPDDDGGDP